MAVSTGVTGRVVRMGVAQCNTWGVPATITKAVYFQDTSALEAQAAYVDDESFNQIFQGAADVADDGPVAGDLPGQLRYDSAGIWMAAAMGSPAAPTVVSSAAANSLIAYSHVINLADNVGQMLTIAADLTRYVVEVPSIVVRGFSFRVGENGRMNVSFNILGSKTVYDSTTNIPATFDAMQATSISNRVFRKDGVWRMNLNTAGALAAGDAIPITGEISLNASRPQAEDFVFGQNYIAQPNDNAFPEFSLEVTYARMNTVAANSFAVAHKAGTRFKADLTFTGLAINPTTTRKMLIEFPNLEVREYHAVATGADNIKPTVRYMAKLAGTSPTGMAFVRPYRVTLTIPDSTVLLAP